MSKELNKEDDKNESKEIEERSSVTKHKIIVKGKEIKYSVTAGTMILKEETEEDGVIQKAEFFYVAYILDGVKNKAKRPITYSFNGGPGSSSVWMHLGVLGPKRVLLDDEGNPPPPPYELVDNDYTILDQTDLVFIDPVSTGFSRSVPGEKAEQFHNYKKDIESVGDFIRLYTSRSKRWNSPKFLVGESYGTTRAAGLSGYLQERHGMYLNGIMLISSILNFSTARFDPGNDLPYLLFLPTYTATAWYHKQLADDLQEDLGKTLTEVEEFVMGEYTLALMKGSTITEEERDLIASKLARYTSLSKEYVLQTDLRINIHRFDKELRRKEGLVVGRLDSRFVGKDRDSAGEVPEMDPSYSAILGPYSATLNQYLQDDLEFESDLPYEILKSLYMTWKWPDHENHYANVGETLRKAFMLNPNLKILVANGYYDLATPYFATDYTFSHLGLPNEQQENIRMTFYEAGHMMYLHIPSLKKLKVDLDSFIKDSTSQEIIEF